MALRSGSVWLALCAMLVGTVSAWALAPHDKAVGVQAERHTQNGIQAEQNAPGEPQEAPETTPIVPGIHTASGDGEGQAKAQQGTEEGTEFWPPLYGYRFKVTDSIIAVFTALLFLATLALWWSTRALVRDASNTAKRQLRAYVGIENGYLAYELDSNTIRAKPVLRIKNVGQTPAYGVTSSVGFAVADDFSKIDSATRIEIEGKTYIFPGGSHRIIGVGKPIHLPDKEGIEIYVFGQIEYFDIFAERKTTSFRFFVRNIDLASRKGEFAPCGSGNDAT